MSYVDSRTASDFKLGQTKTTTELLIAEKKLKTGVILKKCDLELAGCSIFRNVKPFDSYMIDDADLMKPASIDSSDRMNKIKNLSVLLTEKPSIARRGASATYGKDFGVVHGPVAHLSADFSKHLLLEATPQ